MRKYPIGNQDFKGIIEDGYVYVDKTKVIHSLIESGKYYFLSRPRRFGKSLLLSTIKEIFLGNKGLFKGLWIEGKWDWEQKHPVIHIGISQLDYQSLGLYDALSMELDNQARKLGLSLTSKTLKNKFVELIEQAAVQGKVVILIDEYDKPIIDYLDDLSKAEENRLIFKDFYSVLKDADKYIRLLLITGVSKFARMSIFSDLNNLRDITISPVSATLTGITQEELETNFAEEIRELQHDNPTVLGDIKAWYNGYSWNQGKDKVYNPFSLLNFMADRRFGNYWYQTGTPTFLINHMRRKREFLPERGIRLGENALGNFDISHLSSFQLLFQTGYLTIKRYDTKAQMYELDYPNKEVEDSLNDALLSAYRNVFPGGDSLAVKSDLGEALKDGDITALIRSLDALIATIPYEHWKADSESIFHIIAQLSFQKIAADISSEPHSASGRCDIVVRTSNYIYALELKLNATPQEALDQILKKGYLRPYQADKRKKFAVGINFSSAKREVDGYEVMEVE